MLRRKWRSLSKRLSEVERPERVNVLYVNIFDRTLAGGTWRKRQVSQPKALSEAVPTFRKLLGSFTRGVAVFDNEKQLLKEASSNA